MRVQNKVALVEHNTVQNIFVVFALEGVRPLQFHCQLLKSLQEARRVRFNSVVLCLDENSDALV